MYMKPVHGAEVFEAEDVEHSDRVSSIDSRVFFGKQGVIQVHDDPVEERTVQTFGHCVSGCNRLFSSQDFINTINYSRLTRFLIFHRGIHVIKMI